MKRILAILLVLLSFSTVEAAQKFTLTLTSPVPNTFYQHDRGNYWSVFVISGRVNGPNNANVPLAVNWNGYDARIWTDAQGSFYFEWTGLPPGHGYLTVQIRETTISKRVWVTAGDVFVVVGEISTARPFWSYLAIPIRQSGMDVSFVPIGDMHASILDWQPGTALYNTLVNRLRILKGHTTAWQETAQAILWQQGSVDAQNGMSAQDYANYLVTLSDAIYAEFRMPLLPARLPGSSPGISAINAGIAQAVNDENHVFLGADLSGLPTNPNLRTVAQRWYQALAMDAIYPTLP